MQDFELTIRRSHGVCKVAVDYPKGERSEAYDLVRLALAILEQEAIGSRSRKRSGKR